MYDPHTTAVSSALDEATRLQTLRSYHILETEKEESFDQLTHKAMEEFQVPWAIISLVDLGRQWFKSIAEQDDLDTSQTSRRNAFCAHTIQLRDPNTVLEVPDALQDARFCHNPYVTGGPMYRFYAGAALVSPEGQRLGAFCILDRKPRSLSSEQREKLLQLARETIQLLVERKEKVLCGQVSTSVNKQASVKPRVKRTSSQIQPSPVMLESSTAPPELERNSSDSESSLEAAPPKKSRSSLDLASQNVQPREETQEKQADAPKPAVVIPRPRPDAVLPDHKKAGVDPDAYLMQLLEAMYGIKLKVRAALDLQDFFSEIREDQMAAYSTDVVSAARANNVQQLQAYFAERGRPALDCFNRFGEGLLNLACRRGFQDMVDYLLSPTVALNVRTRDDYGRTPLHDACWAPEPQLRICTRILKEDPSLFFIADKRGYTPFQYARSSDWHIWRAFLFRNRHQFAALMEPELLEKFSG